MTCVSLNLNRPDTPEPWRPEPAPWREAKGPSLGSILLVDDDDTVREVIGRVLQDAGYDVTLAGNGEEALAIVDRHPAMDILITDIRMPRMGGRDLSHQMLARQPDLPIIFISGYAADWNPEVEPRLARAFLRKPFSDEDLLTAVQRLLARD